MGCCYSTERETRTVLESTRERDRVIPSSLNAHETKEPTTSNMQAEIPCNKKGAKCHDGANEMKTCDEELLKYEESVREASKKAKAMDENLENEYKKYPNTILYQTFPYDADSPEPINLSSSSEPEDYFITCTRAYSESEIQSSGSFSYSISSDLG